MQKTVVSPDERHRLVEFQDEPDAEDLINFVCTGIILAFNQAHSSPVLGKESYPSGDHS